MPGYYIISIEDVGGLLPFNEQTQDSLPDQIAEEKRVKQELIRFKDTLEKEFHEKITYIGEGKRYGKHLERYLFEHGGFMELILEPPLILKALFLNKEKAERFCTALKHTLKKIIPKNPLKDVFIENIGVDVTQDDPLPIQKWAGMHRIYLKKSIVYTVYTVVAVFIVAMFEIIKASLGYLSLSIMNKMTSFALSVIGAVIIAFLFEPIKKKTEAIVSKYMSL